MSDLVALTKEVERLKEELAEVKDLADTWQQAWQAESVQHEVTHCQLQAQAAQTAAMRSELVNTRESLGPYGAYALFIVRSIDQALTPTQAEEQVKRWKAALEEIATNKGGEWSQQRARRALDGEVKDD